MFYTVAEARRQASLFRDAQTTRKSASQVLTESVEFAERKTYDVFLSHSFQDADIVLGVKRLIEKQGKSVYVDWVEDKFLDRANVTPATADVLRRRMRQSLSLIYVSSPNTSSSKWMPWELGYFDGFKPNMVSIMPLVAIADTEWKGVEYLGLYPVVNRLTVSSGENLPFIVRKDNSALPLKQFGSSTSYIYKDVQGRAL